MKRNNAWNIRRLVDESFVPSTQRIMLKIVGFLAAKADTVLCHFNLWLKSEWLSEKKDTKSKPKKKRMYFSWREGKAVTTFSNEWAAMVYFAARGQWRVLFRFLKLAAIFHGLPHNLTFYRESPNTPIPCVMHILVPGKTRVMWNAR